MFQPDPWMRIEEMPIHRRIQAVKGVKLARDVLAAP